MLAATMKRTATLCCAALLGAAALAPAQQPAAPAPRPAGAANQGQPQNQDDEPIQDEENKRRFWEAALPGGHFQVALDRIVSISMHEYVLDGSVVVTEVTVDTAGQALPRFYYLEPVSDRASGTGTGAAVAGIVDRGRQLLERAGERAGTEVHNMVQKKYGVSTHTKTLEYRVLSMDELTAIYNSVRRAWDSGRGRRITIR